jgi:two-component system, NtrC family, response regulator
MTQQSALQIPDLKSLIEQLCLGRGNLEQLISLLCELNTAAVPAEPNPAQRELSLVGQEQSVRRNSINNRPDYLPPRIIIAEDSRMQIAAGLVRSMAEMDAAVLIQGATGTGKSLFAQLIHQQGKRSQRPLVTVPCRQLNHSDAVVHIMEFIHEADNGSLVLEDVNELHPAVQKHLSKLLQQAMTCRLISLTCNDLDELVRQKMFSAILLEQLAECNIALPNLASRATDIEQLARYYCQRFCVAADMAQKQLSPEYLNLLALYSWPGNVRELINTMEQSLLSAGEQKTLYVKDLPAHIRIQTLHLSSARKKGL